MMSLSYKNNKILFVISMSPSRITIIKYYYNDNV